MFDICLKIILLEWYIFLFGKCFKQDINTLCLWYYFWDPMIFIVSGRNYFKLDLLKQGILIEVPALENAQ
jgi:hypothetical protein